MAVNDPRFQKVIDRIDQENAKDPIREKSGQESVGRELLYSRRLSEWVLKLEPNATKELLIAARGQHICRWQIPRSSYDMNRIGYLKWREALKKFHADKTCGLMNELGCGESSVERVRLLITKKLFPSDPEAVVLEDALNLCFLQYQLKELAQKTERGKMIEILRKAWRKISPKARQLAAQLRYENNEKTLLDEALSPSK